MGGRAFTTPAQRLTPTQHAQLYAFAQERLGEALTLAVARHLPRPSHGDLDLLCGWEGAAWTPGKGRSRGAVGAAEAEAATTTLTLGVLLAERGLEGVTLSSGAERLDAWCDALAHALGGVQWIRLGGEVNVAVPVGVLSDTRASFDDATKETGEEPSPDSEGHSPFFQVDVILAPNDALPFLVWTHSYALTTFLSPLCRASVPELKIQSHRAVLRTPGGWVHLTHDPGEVCAFLGLGYDAWLGLEAGDMEQVYRWLAGVDPGSRMARGLRRVARGEVGVKGKQRAAAEALGGWLRGEGWGGAGAGGEGEAEMSLGEMLRFFGKEEGVLPPRHVSGLEGRAAPRMEVLSPATVKQAGAVSAPFGVRSEV